MSPHETWIAPTQFFISPGQPLIADLTSGMAFPALEHPIKPERIAHAQFRLGSTHSPVRHFETTEQSLRLTVPTHNEGLATLSISLHQFPIELSHKTVLHYFDEIGATDHLRAQWDDLKNHAPWKEAYTKHAKIFAAIGNAASDTSWQTPVGMALELIPAQHPADLRAGESATFTLLANGLPLTNSPVGLLAEGSSTRLFQTTDSLGQVAFPIRNPGMILIYAVQLTLDEQTKTWTSDFTTLTLHVR